MKQRSLVSRKEQDDHNCPFDAESSKSLGFEGDSDTF
jgi:hypothetical protein